MNIFPAIDIYEGKAVRLLKGEYSNMTVYGENPTEFALDFAEKGAKHIHIVDLEGAKTGETPNLETVLQIKKTSGLFCEIGGGIRSMETVERYIGGGMDRVILGTAAIENRKLLEESLERYGEKIAVGIDIRDGRVAIKGWLEKTETDAIEFCQEMQTLGVSTLIVTDISRDGAMKGTNQELYRNLSENLDINVTASGGVSTIDDIKALAESGIYGAIIGKAYYTGAIDLTEALKVASQDD